MTPHDAAVARPVTDDSQASPRAPDPLAVSEVLPVGRLVDPSPQENQDHKPLGTHSLTLEFRQILNEAEWREVAELARTLPYVQGLTANYTPPSAARVDPSPPALEAKDVEIVVDLMERYQMTDRFIAKVTAALRAALVAPQEPSE